MTDTKAKDKGVLDRAQGQTESREHLEDLAERIADDNRAETTNGNRHSLKDSKAGSAQRGGPDIDKAQDRQPPDSEIARDSGL